MTTYRGTPVSEGAAVGELFLPGVPAAARAAAAGTGAAGTGAAAGAGTKTGAGTGAGAGKRGAGKAASQPAPSVTADDVRAAFAAVADDRHALAGRLRAAGRAHEADIVTIGALMAADPALSGPALDALTATGGAASGQAGAPTGRQAASGQAGASAGQETAAAPAAPAGAEPVGGQAEHGIVLDDRGHFPLATVVAAITAAAETQALILQALPDPDLAQRASDVRQVATAVITRLGGATEAPPPATAFILVAAEVDPADLIRLADAGHLAGAVSVGGGASSHAAIVARGLGLPMLAGADPAVLTAAAGHPAILDATGLDTTGGQLRVDPPLADLARVHVTGGEAAPKAQGAARTADGELVTILCNVASAAETRLGLANGAAGVGLLRTEIPFTRAAGWPSRDEHLAALAPVLGLLHGRRAVVRLLDFAGDKIPPFPGAAGLPAFLHAPGALAAQLAAILRAGAGTDLAVMIPMVRALDEVDLVRAELVRAAKAVGADPPPLGMMVELAATAEAAPAFAGRVDFFSIGTNDLTADVLRRERSALRPSDAAERRVLTAIGTTVRAAREAGIGLSVCGDAAADPVVLPRLLALGVATVSVGAAKVPAVARWIAQASTSGPPGTGQGRATVPDAG